MIRIPLVLSGNTNCWPSAAALRRRALGSSNGGKTPHHTARYAAARFISSPYDPDAHYAKKRTTTWVG